MLCYFAKSHFLSTIILNVIMLSAVLLSVIAPYKTPNNTLAILFAKSTPGYSENNWRSEIWIGREWKKKLVAKIAQRLEFSLRRLFEDTLTIDI